MLGEFAQHSGCFDAWRVFRLLTMWAGQTPAGRPGLLEIEGVQALLIRLGGNELGAVGEQRVALLCILSEMIAAAPDMKRLAYACMLVTDWALTAGAVETALAYARAAAELSGDARYTWLTGRLHRENGRVLQSEAWFHAAHRLASRSHDREVEARSLLSCGYMLLTVGRYAAARPYFERALLVAERFKFEDHRLEAHHYLFIAASAMQDYPRIARHSRVVASGYGPGHPRRPNFIHDLALYWMSYGDYERARDALFPLLEQHFHDQPANRLLGFASALRAVAGCGDHRAFDRLMPAFADLREPAGSSPLVAQALCTAGLGASLLKRWSDVEALLVPAVEAAKLSGQEDTQTSAENLLDRLP